MMYSCTKETFGEQHVQLMMPIKTHIQTVLSEATDLMKQNAMCACHGGFDEKQARSLRDSISRTREATAALSAEFRATTSAVGLPHISEELLDEHAFCFNICYFGRECADFAEELLGHKRAEDLLGGSLAFELSEDASGASVVFDPSLLFDGQHVNFAVRNTTAIVLAFVVGYFGYGKVLKPLDAGISSTSAVLLSKYIGSAMKQNLGRLQGVVLGTIVGQLVYAVFGRCEWWGYLATGVILWSWVSITLFTYYDSTKYAGVACLISAFGAQNFVLGCSSAVFVPSKTYYKIIDAVVAILIITTVDFVLAPARASVITHISYMTTWGRLRDFANELLDPTVPEITFHRNSIVSSLRNAETLGKEAKEEPRSWRTPWRKKTFSCAIQCAHRLQVSISAMEYCMAKGGHDGAKKAEVLSTMCQMDSFKQVGNMLMAKMSMMETFMKIFLHELPGSMEELQDPKFRRDTRGQDQQLLRNFMEHANKEGCFKQNSVSSMEECPVAQVSVFLSAIDAMMEEMSWFQHRVLQDM